MRRPFRDTYELWDARATAGHPPRATSISLLGSRGTLVLEGESAAGEIVIAMGCGVEANIDRPLLATGSAPSLARIVAGYTLVHAGTDATLLIEGVSVPLPLPPGQEPPPKTLASFVIENAVLRTTGVDALVAYGKLTGLRATQGVVFLGNALERVIPILPDPYASNIDLRQEVVAETLVAITAWASPPDPHLAFAILRPPQSNGATNLAAFDANATFANSNRLARVEGGIGELYDVSSAQNQFGVALTAQALAQSQIFGQQLAVTAQQSGLFTVPAISWEPVLDIGRSWFFPISADDGPPAVVVVPTVALRPLEPAAFYDAFLADYAKGADLIANLTLPFGLTATVDTRAQVNTQPPIPRPGLHAIEPKFPDDRTGGKQLSIQGVYDATNQRTVLPGSSRADTPYVEDMLSQGPAHVVANMWDEDFGGQPVVGAVTTHFVPVSRYDLSGYGATTFSDFQYLGDETGITEARFDVIVGRTLYELVEAQSYILPWYIPVINTTIFSRDATGYVNRFNTGWRAKTDGTFKFPNGAAEIEHGGVVGVFNIRNIVEGAEEIVALRKYVRVTFDADVQIVVDPALHGLKVTGGNPSGRIPSRGLTGYLVADAKDKPDIAESIRVLDALGPAVGPIAAEVDVNETGIAIGLTGVEITATRPDVVRVNPAFPRTIAASLRGTPRLPRDGSWSVAMRAGTSAVPQPIPPTTPVPLIRANADPATWRIADGADVVKLDAPLHFYGILQATGANKVFFEHPTIRKIAGTNPLNFDKSPKLADVGKLLGDNGLLPDILSLLDFGGFDGLAKSGDGFALKKTLKNSVDLGSRTLIPLSIIRLVMTSWSDPPGQPKPTEITLDLDPAGSPRWAIAIKNIAFKLVVDGWGGDADPLITVHGDASAHDGAAPTLSNLGVKYGESLSVVKSILTEIEQFISFLPGMKGAGLDVSFAGSKLRVREAFPLPKLPLGLGYLE
ncbi:MAG: hypothetical protein JWN27_3128, partial [Candidatus Eremiobacteraeota bacterium]|nr:hypothetical protein [Candidatus Eremiobacteraeota bacterium]